MKHYGLTNTQVSESKAKYGDNRLTELKSEGFWTKLKHNLGDPMIKILCAALLINVILVILGQAEWYEAVGIAAAVLLATLVSTFSEYRNENAFQKLQEEASKITCKVYRNGQITEISIDNLVVGDCVLLQTGDKIPADGILIEGELHADQSVLNGETKEAQKLVKPADKENTGDEKADNMSESIDFLNPYKLFRGSVVCSGNAVMSVTTVGDKSVYGHIAGELQQDTERDTPLKVKLRSLAKGISRFGYIGGIAIAVALLFQRIVVHNGFDIAQITAYCSNWTAVVRDAAHALMLAVVVIVMAVPEGLPLMIAIVSALNMGKMLKDNVLVRKIAGIETAGSLNILFSDKTGTITKGELEVVTFVSGDVKEYKTLNTVPEELSKILAASIHGNTGAVVSKDGSAFKVIGGNATERAVMTFALMRTGIVNVTPIRSIPFNSTNKYSVSQVEGDHNLTLIKGAPEKILGRCKSYYDENGQEQPLRDLSPLGVKIDAMASRAIRVLAFAVSKENLDSEQLPDGDWVLVGVVGIRDEVRPESVTAIREVQSAGVQVIMITGDRLETAAAIAKDAGLLTDKSDIVMTSAELADMSDDALKEKLKNVRVIARALPSDKSRLVRLAQDLNLVVGMTGDGVNDSPALKAADVGFAMGGGTEVAKEASDIIIMDDNFNSIDKAILYGRTIFNNIRKFIVFQLTINAAAVLISFIAPLLGMENPLSIIQILWVNLVIDTLAALAFGGEPALKRFMKEKPKKRNGPIVSGYMWGSILTGSIFIFGLSMFFLLSDLTKLIFRENSDNLYLLTGFFAFFIFISIFNAFNARTEQLNVFDSIFKNMGFLYIMALIIAGQVIMTYLGGVILRCYGLTLREWGFVLVLAFLIIPVSLIRNLICRLIGKRNS
ncbi:MAG: cation-translocating P-type ATPase [Oscillospiraceae bacterium]|jgi:calcium-translocating P-type ATPase|nr:cation-translocating P-type ATPase [Oscillospiraceae bacterium]